MNKNKNELKIENNNQNHFDLTLGLWLAEADSTKPLSPSMPLDMWDRFYC